VVEINITLGERGSGASFSKNQNMLTKAMYEIYVRFTYKNFPLIVKMI
jgi:hypothetical protein